MSLAPEFRKISESLRDRRPQPRPRVLTDEQIDALATIVGEENVSAQPIELSRTARTTLPDGTTPAGILWASSREQVQAVVGWAAAHDFPIYPISTGKNWGYGDLCAPIAGCLLLDLSRMNRILEVDVALAYAVVEPGVTQGRLAEYLKERNLPLMVDATGAGPDASLIGNTLERGFGHTEYGDRSAHVVCLEAVLPDGSLLTTGFGAYPNAKARHVYKCGLGPSLDGLLTQSNFAIVTRMTVWLMPRPPRLLAYFITLSDRSAIGPLIERLRPLRLAGTLRSISHCFNDRRLLTGAARFPYDRLDGRQAVEVADPQWVERVCRERRISAWAVSGSITGTPSEVQAARKALRRALSGLPGLQKVFFVDERKLARLERLTRLAARLRPLAPLAALVRNLRLGFQLLNGTPVYESLKGSHWRSRGDPGPTQDPLASQCGLVWVSPVLPMTAAAVEELERIAEPILHRFGFEFQVSMAFLNERSICAILPISFDRGSPDETARARDCHEQLLQVLLDHGYVPYRGSVAAQKKMREAAPVYWQAVARLKKAWDPADILAPGRYVQSLRDR
jgi:4-cresol dehydrogenase (hydroxylating) flavoprotein subunit